MTGITPEHRSMGIPQWAELTPSYGRDYKSAAAAKADFFAARDFTLAATGQQMTILDCDLGSTVYLRYAKLTKVTPVRITMQMLSDARTAQELLRAGVQGSNVQAHTNVLGRTDGAE